MKIYHSFNKQGEFCGSFKAQISPLHKELTFLCPANATFEKPPQEIPEEKIIKFNKKNRTWELVDDPAVIKRKEQEEKERIERLLQEKDAEGFPIYKLVDGKLEFVSEAEKESMRLQRKIEAIRDFIYVAENNLINLLYNVLLKDNDNYKKAVLDYKQEIEKIKTALQEGRIEDIQSFPKEPKEI